MTFRCAVVLALACAGQAQAARVGEVLVRQGNGGVPCFTISEAEERRGGAPNFQSITVSDTAGPGHPAMWSMTMPKRRTFPVTFRMCVPYAGRSAVLPQMPATPLKPGRVYEVAIEARGPFGPSSPHSYRAHFCLLKGAAGVRTVPVHGRQRYACGA